MQMKCIAHSVQLCLRHFFTQWNDIIEFLAAMRSLTKRSKSFKLRESARERNILISKFDFTPTRWSSCTPGLVSMTVLDHWVAVYEWLRDLRQEELSNIVALDEDDDNSRQVSPWYLMSRLNTKINTAWEFVSNPFNFGRVFLLLCVCQAADRITLEVSKDFPGEELLARLTEFHDMMVQLSGTGTISKAVSDLSDKNVATLRERLQTIELAATQCATKPDTEKKPKRSPSLRTTGSARGGSVETVARAADHVDGTKEDDSPLVEAATKTSRGRAPKKGPSVPQREPSKRARIPTTKFTDAGFAQEAEMGAMMSVQLQEGVFAFSDEDKPLADAQIMTGASAAAKKALDKYKKHIEAVMHLIRARFAFYPWVRPTTESEVDARVMSSKGQEVLFHLDWENYMKAWVPWPEQRPKTQDEAVKYWTTPGNHFGSLADAALRALALSLSSVSVERAFSIQKHIESNFRRSTMTQQHVIEQLEMRTSGGDFIHAKLRQCLDALMAAKALDKRCRPGGEEGRSTSDQLSSAVTTSTPPIDPPHRITCSTYHRGFV
ncbi:MAG: hypothetical protein EOO65_02035 [Methanosarcinales archaeon]|nr:MAG: hypothetical protein EOO65_02035 [Methanosarcinales archaeon]